MMKEHLETFESSVQNVIESVSVNIEVANYCEEVDSYVNTLSNVISLGERVIFLARDYDLKVNYLNQFNSTFKKILGSLPYNGQGAAQFACEQDKSLIRKQIANHEPSLKNLASTLDFEIGFF